MHMGTTFRSIIGVLEVVRFTPMHMGTTRMAIVVMSPPTVHPHAHGDNFFQYGTGATAFGSPPCTWGQLLLRPAACGRYRFTPMHMGTTESMRSLSDNHRGSPPCTWGQRLAMLFPH